MTQSTRWRVGFIAVLLGGAALVMAATRSTVSPASLERIASAETRARQIIDRAIAAHGGRQAWRKKKDAAFSTTWTHYKDGEPSFRSRYVVKFPIAAGATAAVVEAEENGKPVVMGVSGSSSWFVVGEERHEDLESLRTNRAFVRRAYGLLALPFCLEEPGYTAVYDGEEVRAGAVVDRVRVERGLEPPGLYLFDRETGRLVGMGSPVSDPPTATVGDADDFTVVEGILIPRTRRFDRIDQLTGTRARALEVSVDLVRFDNGFGPETFEPPPVR